MELREALERAGFETPAPAQVFDVDMDNGATGLEDVKRWVQKMEDGRAKLRYDVDGLVVKVNERPLQLLLGATAKAPRWAIAAKFTSLKAITTIAAIDVSVGRTGQLTPVAVLNPVRSSSL
jgi:DNA ligase (NAD+)